MATLALPGLRARVAESAWAIERARYRATHRTLAAALGVPSLLWHLALGRGTFLFGKQVRRALKRGFDDLLDADLRNAERGVYPRSLLFPSPFEMDALRLPEIVLDLPWILRRGLARDAKVQAPASEFPRYYRRAFHWQTGGWLSAASARRYDLGVELLFFGTAGIMRRMTLPHLARGLAGRKSPRILDVACGTGRFLSTLRATFPKARLSGIDLSPSYVGHARAHLGPEVTLSAENAESMPFDGGLFDGAVSIYLFHELPPDARRNVMKETFRVLAPGGTFAICDSLQRAEAAAAGLGDFQRAFPRLYHEPYYAGYVKEPLESLLEAAGFEVTAVESRFFSKIVAARKPLRARRRSGARSPRKRG